ncbi:MAG: DUF2817 domain-containing protein [Desulfococcaceae bacterium]|jgi:protein MpaA|nr:DUF2817 domain-containing protein [Desulfococcaceae bacterium]
MTFHKKTGYRVKNKFRPDIYIQYIYFFPIVIIHLLLWGCASPPSPVSVIQKAEIPVSEFIAGYSVQNRPILCIRAGNGEEIILLVASIHGDEIAGTPLAYSLLNYFRNNPHLLEGRTVFFLPLANPDGVAAYSRFNRRNVDLNRNFPSANRQDKKRSGDFPSSEPETRTIMQLIRTYRPARIISIHEPMNCIDYDGPGESLAAFISDYCYLPVKKIGAMPGSLGSYAGAELGIPVITLELPEEAAVMDTEILWQLYGKALLASVLYPQKPEHSFVRTEMNEKKARGKIPEAK